MLQLIARIIAAFMAGFAPKPVAQPVRVQLGRHKTTSRYSEAADWGAED